jgi:chromosome segregation ATPase
MENEIQRREPDLRLLLEKGNRVLSDTSLSPMSAISDISDTIDAIKSEEKRLKQKLKDKAAKVRQANAVAEKFHQDLGLLDGWLKNQEEKVDGLPAVGPNMEAVGKQLKTVQGLQTEMLKKSRDHENLNAEGEHLLQITDKDHEIVKEKLDYVNRKWDDVSGKVSQNVGKLEDAQQRLQEFNDAMKDVSTTLENCEGQISKENMSEAKKDLRNVERLRNLQDQVESIQPQIVELEKMLATFDQPGFDRKSMDTFNSELDKVKDRYNKATELSQELVGQVEEAKRSVHDFEQLVRAEGSQVADLEDEFENKAPVGRDLDIVEQQIHDVKVSRLSWIYI